MPVEVSFSQVGLKSGGVSMARNESLPILADEVEQSRQLLFSGRFQSHRMESVKVAFFKTKYPP
jgi:hypothetical protein